MKIFELLQLCIEKGATDLHLTVNSPPVLRILGDLVLLQEKALNPHDIEEMVGDILKPDQKERLALNRSVDLAYTLDGASSSHRFRVNVFYQKGTIAIAFRLLYDEILPIEELNLPVILYNFCEMRDGLILMTGPTGSGKTTTLAALLDRINRAEACHIITVEDPIEYIHKHKKSIVNQREVYTDVLSFADGLKYALREDPDVILVGEMRDLETMRTALMAAETGHLVFSTLHSRDVVSTINRIIGSFPSEEQGYIRTQLSMVMKAVVSQRLLRRKDRHGRIPAVEIMLVTSGISNMIRMGKDEQIYSVIETGRAMGMQTMEDSLLGLYRAGIIDQETVSRTVRKFTGEPR
jgi:twitching motility protein PilT